MSGNIWPLEEGMAIYSSILVWRIPWTEEPGWLQQIFIFYWSKWQDEALARDGVSREVPCSALKGGKDPASLHATPKSSPTRRVPSRGTPRVPAPLPLSPFSPPDRDRIQPSHPLSSPSLPALNLSQHQGLFQCLGTELGDSRRGGLGPASSGQSSRKASVH